MYKGINIKPDHAKIVTEILRRILPDNSHIWVFGSRLKHQIKPFSDLDLAIDCEQKPLTISQLADLKEAFSESDLPYKVDIVDINAVSSEFLEIINENKVLFD